MVLVNVVLLYAVMLYEVILNVVLSYVVFSEFHFLCGLSLSDLFQSYLLLGDIFCMFLPEVLLHVNLFNCNL